MSEIASHSKFLGPQDSEHQAPYSVINSGKTTKGGNEAVKWEVVAEMAGITLAAIVAGRLKAHGLPVRVWQEGAGQALGLTVGLLGTGYVAVPEEYLERASAILAEDVAIDPDEWEEEFNQSEEQVSSEELLDENK
jgi:hypothetical protein